MKKFIVETYYTCTFKTVHTLSDLNDAELSKIDQRNDGKVEVIDVKLNNRKTKKLGDKEDVKKQDPKNPIYKKYFMHGTSHHLGLDVHDVGNFYVNLSPGNVFTVEAGIYIREENLGVRLEDNILIGENQNHNLMKNIPILPEEIEDIMNS